MTVSLPLTVNFFPLKSEEKRLQLILLSDLRLKFVSFYT